MCVLNHVRLFVTPCTVAHQAPLSMGFPRKESWSGLPVPPPRDLPDLEIEPTSFASPSLTGRFSTTVPPTQFTADSVEGEIQGGVRVRLAFRELSVATEGRMGPQQVDLKLLERVLLPTGEKCCLDQRDGIWDKKGSLLVNLNLSEWGVGGGETKDGWFPAG